MKVFSVAVDAPIDSSLTYLAPEGDGAVFNLSRGSLVKVPLGKGGRLVQGIVINEETLTEKPKYPLKQIAEVSGDQIKIPEAYMAWGEWLANYYLHPLGQVLNNMIPPLGKSGRAARKKSPIPKVDLVEPHSLNQQQKDVVDSIPVDNNFKTHLIFGVTGSGKTEVYLELFEKAIANGKQCLFLLPEISLTPQLLRRFAERFGDQLAVIHSQLTEREKTNQWWQMIDGNKKILLGARSALFCPCPNIGLIVIDEEHEASYKQEEKLKYSARDSAVVLANKLKCPVILGSATPSLESWNNALLGRYQLHRLRERVGSRALPEVKIIDLREEENKPENSEAHSHIPHWMSPSLFDAIKLRLENGQQSALFLNRRGISQSVICDSCGFVKECPNCAISLSLHAKTHLLCHYCDYNEPLPNNCPQCGDGEMVALGLGTERIENELLKLFPNAKVARADRDEIQTREDMEDLITNMENQTVDILVGTQMIAKGLDFPNLSLVSLILADIGFNIPDFRATERSFQLLTQVSGRAGRHKIPGEVLIQTYNPDHPSVQFASRVDFEAFATEELGFRKELNYPPFGKIASIRLQGLDLYKVEKAAHTLANLAQQAQDNHSELSALQILGPTQAPLFKLRSKFRYQLLIKSPNSSLLTSFCKHLLSDTGWLPPAVQISVDIDPMQLS